MEIFLKRWVLASTCGRTKTEVFESQMILFLASTQTFLGGSSRVPEPLRTSAREAILFYSIILAFACGRVIRYVWTGPKY